MDIHGHPWISMGIHGYPWISMDIHGCPWISMDIHGYPWISMDIRGYPWIGQMIPTGFGYGYSQSGMPPHSQTKEGGYAKFFHLRRPSSNCLETPFRLLDSAVFLGSLVCGKVAALVVVVARACALVVAAHLGIWVQFVNESKNQSIH